MLTEIVMSEYLDAQLNLSDNFICVVDEEKKITLEISQNGWNILNNKLIIIKFISKVKLNT